MQLSMYKNRMNWNEESLYLSLIINPLVEFYNGFDPWFPIKKDPLIILQNLFIYFKIWHEIWLLENQIAEEDR